MSLIAAGYGTPETPADAIQNNGFWPDIDPTVVRDAERIDSNITAARLTQALQVAMADINRQLSAWQLAQQDAGFTTIDAVPVPVWQTPDAYSLLYRRAVYATAHASLLERYREVSATAQGDERGEAKNDAADDYRRDARWAVSEITGLNHTTVELI